MIDEVLVFLKKQLNNHFDTLAGVGSDNSVEERVVFPDTEKVDPIKFKAEAVTVLLLNLEQEKLLRPADLHARVNTSGASEKVNPEIRLELSVLFVANAKQYDRGLKYLSSIVKFFHEHRVFDQRTAPDLGDSIEKLVLELNTLSLSEQNDIWSGLRTSSHPAVLYKVKMVTYADSVGVEQTPVLSVESSARQVIK